MQASSRIPPQLQPHTKLPEPPSILLLTSTLGASANWLTIRFLYDALHEQRPRNAGDVPEELGAAEEEEGGGGGGCKVVLVSWMREWEFWRGEARKGVGLDLQRLVRDRRVAFVDGLSKLYLPAAAEPATTVSPPVRTGPSLSPQRAGLVPAGGPQNMLPVRTPAARPTPTTPAASASRSDATTPGHFYLTSAEPSHLLSTVESALSHVQSTASASQKTLLILDSPDALLATSPTLMPTALTSTLLQLHTLATHVLVHLSADDALLSLSSPPQPLEVKGHNLLVKLAHMSSRVVSCRVLDTGVARDVSGVVSITGGGGGGVLASGKLFEEENEEETRKELLYLVKGDGSVKVFERGAGEG